MKYSASANGFFLPEVHGAAIPPDAVDITDQKHADLLLGQSQGLLIAPGPGGVPQLVEPTPPTPAEALAAERARMVVSRFQARAALHLAGLLPQVEAAVNAADPMVQIAWADAQEFRRSSPTIAALAVALELDDETLDQLFRDAAQIAA